VPITPGVAQASVKVSAGARALIQFADGDATKPIVTGWGTATATEINLGAGTQYVALGTDVRTELDAIWTVLAAHLHGGVVAGGAASGPATVTPVKQTILATVVKAK